MIFVYKYEVGWQNTIQERPHDIIVMLDVRKHMSRYGISNGQKMYRITCHTKLLDNKI